MDDVAERARELLFTSNTMLERWRVTVLAEALELLAQLRQW